MALDLVRQDIVSAHAHTQALTKAPVGTGTLYAFYNTNLSN